MEMNAANVAQHKIFSISFWRPEVTSLSSKPKVENLIKQLFHSPLLDMRLVIANSALRASLAIYHLISNARSWNNCQLLNSQPRIMQF